VAVRLDDLNDTRVHIHTGFPSLLSLLGFIAVVCNGDIDTTTKTTSSLTWLEEWYFYLEFVYGRSITRYVDACDKYDLSDHRLREVFDKKLEMVMKAMKEWPRYCSYKEDEMNRQKEKWSSYNGQRVIMFDNTKINIRQPTDAEAQRSTYSVYYAGNVGKGAVFIQPCGWQGSYELWTGGVSDTTYMNDNKIFSHLSEYILTSDMEDDETRTIPFTIILD
jgi:hypothetical protein